MTPAARTYIFTGFIVFALCASAVIVAMPAEAQEDAGDAFRERREEVRERMELLQSQASRTNDRAASTTEAVRAAVEERRDQLSDRLRDRIKNLLDNMTHRMEAAINRLTNIALRMETRIEKLERAGADGSEAKEHIAAARDALRKAQNLLSGNFEDTVNDAISSETPRAHIAEIHTTFTEAAKLIRDAHLELREALRALKNAVASGGSGASEAVRADASENATSTGETE